MTTYTNDELNVAICEWRGVTPSTNHIDGIEALGHMNEAASELPKDQRNKFMECLDSVVPVIEGGEANYSEWHLIHATARQRAIALLRVVKPEMFTE